MQIQNIVASLPGSGLGTAVANNRLKMNAVFADQLSALKQDRVTLSADYKTGDKVAIAADKKAISDLEASMKENRNSLMTVHGDVAEMRTLRKQLVADNKAKDVQASQQDREAISSMHDKIISDIGQISDNIQA